MFRFLPNYGIPSRGIYRCQGCGYSYDFADYERDCAAARREDGHDS